VDEVTNDPRKEKPRLGPWLSSYGRRERRPLRERATEWTLAGLAAVGFLAAAVGMLWLFIRYPFPVLGALAAVWVIGFVIFTVVSRRSRARERSLHDGSLFEELRRVRRERR